jgi:hypothetical protein
VLLGTASVAFTQGALGDMPDGGQSVIVSEGRKLGIIIKQPVLNYPGEHFAFDGNKVTIGYIDFNVRSKLGDFLRQFHGLLKEGLLGGTLSVAWPLLDFQERDPQLKYAKRKFGGRPLHELRYSPKSRSGMERLQIKLFFDPETFRHVMTSYIDRSEGIQNYVAEFKEQFDDFREVDGVMLPHRYTIDYSVTGNFIGHWTIKAQQCRHNVTIDAQLFRATSMRKSD